MKKKLGILFALLCCTSALLALGACRAGGAPYDGLNGLGATVSVRFDAGEGLIAGTTGVYVVDVFEPSKMQKDANGALTTPLLAPNSPLRGNSSYEVSRTGHFLAGWYATRTETEGGYIYEDRWDFDTDLLTLDPNKTYDANEEVLTLYAAWVPYCTYEFYGEDGSLLDSMQDISVEYPAWDEKTGKLDMNGYPSVSGKTFLAAYLDEARTEQAPEVLTVSYDLDRITPDTATTVKLYTTWREGTWFRIKTPEQLLNNARLDGSYEILADLNFADAYWPALFTSKNFKGTFEGNGHKISNVRITQTDGKQMQGGLFGGLDAGAVLRNIGFENITYTLGAGSMTTDARFGLLAGMISAEAQLEGVTVTGSLLIGKNCFPSDSYLIGLVCGLGSCELDFSGITCAPAEEGQESPAITVDEESGEVTLSFS